MNARERLSTGRLVFLPARRPPPPGAARQVSYGIGVSLKRQAYFLLKTCNSRDFAFPVRSTAKFLPRPVS